MFCQKQLVSQVNVPDFNASFDCVEQVIIFNKWKGRLLSWNKSSLVCELKMVTSEIIS